MSGEASVTQQQEDRIMVKVVGIHPEPIFYRLKMDTILGTLKSAYSQRVGVPVTALKFKYYSVVVDDNYTPAMLDMVHSDEIQVTKLKVKLPSEE